MPDLHTVIFERALSSSPTYGRAVATTLNLGQHYRINNVDCTSGPDGAVYVTWDRHALASSRTTTGKLARIDYYSVSWVTDVGASYLNPPPSGYNVYAHRPRVALSPTTDTLLVASGQRDLYGVAGGSGQHWEAFRASDGQFLQHDSTWCDLCHSESYDVEWNEASHFVLLSRMEWDFTNVPWYETIMVGTNGLYTSRLTIQSYDPQHPELFPRDAVLVYSPTAKNSGNYLIALTDRKVYWIRRADGSLRGSTSAFDPSPRVEVHGCEYWGDRNRIAHSFTEHGSSSYETIHRHWSIAPSFPQESYWVSPTGYYPKACAAVDTSGDTDREVVLVRALATGGSSVYWDMEAED
jgi:hypothetical protein